jgi:hypothetical protein
VQELPLRDASEPPPGGLVRKAPAARKAPVRKATAPGKRAAAAATETPAQHVVPVPPAGRAGSMPPTDLDVVDVLDGFEPFDDDDDGPDTVIVLPPSPEDEAFRRHQAFTATEPEEHDGPTGPISLRARPQPAPVGPPPAPPGGPPAP